MAVKLILERFLEHGGATLGRLTAVGVEGVLFTLDEG